MNPEPSPRRALLHPAMALGVVCLLPILGATRWRADIVIGCLLWATFCRLLVERWFGRARPDDGFELKHGRVTAVIHRHAAGLLATVLGAVGVVFVRSWDMWMPLLLLPAPALILDAASARFGHRWLRYYARIPSVTLLACLVVTVAGYRSMAERTGWPDTNDDFVYALRASPPPASLSIAERTAAVQVVRATLTGQPLPQDLPEGLGVERRHRAWVTLFRKARRGRWTRGTGTPGTLADQLVEATEDAMANARGRIWASSWSKVRVQIDLEGPGQRLGGVWLRRLVRAPLGAVTGRMPWSFIQYDDEAGVDGFTMTVGDNTATVLPADPLIDGWYTPRRKKTRYRHHNWERVLQELVRRGKFEAADPWPEGAELLNFRTYSFAEPDPQGSPGRTIELFRGNVPLRGALNERRLLTAISDAGEWLLRTVEDDGKFDYEYFPTRDDHGRSYNEVRHAGSVYGLFHMANMAAREEQLRPRREAYVSAGVKALSRVYDMLGSPPGVDPSEGYVAFLQGKDGSRTNSGAQALTLISLLERPTPDSVSDPTLRAALSRDGDAETVAGLAKTLGAMVDDRGWVYRTWAEARAGAQMERQPLYFPGEVLLALVRYHEATGDEEALQIAKKVGLAQIDYAKRPWEIPDHWVMQALDRLDALDPGNRAWRNAAYWMGADYADEQYPPQVPHAADYRGAYRRDLEIARTTRAASRGEAIGGVARIAWRRGDPSSLWERSLLGGARHLIEQQFTPDNTFHFPVPEETWGAIRMGLIDNHCRIDNNQHAIVALDNALEALRRQTGVR